MPKHAILRRDVVAGLLLAALGTGAVIEGLNHSVGILTRMGAGYFPIILGCILTLLGLFIAGTAALGSQSAAGVLPTEAEEISVSPDWRGISAIVAAVLAFLVIGRRYGMAPAVFCCVLLASLGDRSTSVKGALTLAVVMTAFSVGLFAYLLKVQFPVLIW